MTILTMMMVIMMTIITGSMVLVVTNVYREWGDSWVTLYTQTHANYQHRHYHHEHFDFLS